MITHVFGHPNNMMEAKKICKKYKLKLIEDASEALGLHIKINMLVLMVIMVLLVLMEIKLLHQAESNNC